MAVLRHLPSKLGSGIRINSNNCNPIITLISELIAARRNDASGSVLPSPPALPLLPKTPPMALALTPNVVKTNANPAANAKVGNIVFLSSLSLAAFVIYDTVMGSNPNAHGLNDVNNPAVYSIANDFIDSNDDDIVDDVAAAEEDAEGMTVLAKEAPAFCALNIMSSTPKYIAVVD